MPRALAIILAFLCWVYASAAVATTALGQAAVEDDTQEGQLSILFPLTVFAWFAAGALIVAVAAQARRPAIALWSIQAALLVAGFLMTAGAGGVRVAPPVLLVGIAAQVAGFLAASRTPPAS
jgi:hypothetical protein